MAGCLTLICIYLSLSLFAFNPGFYKSEFDKYQADKTVNMTPDSLMRVTEHMISYLNGKKDDLVIKENIGGIHREFFNDLEKQHMVDVKVLFEKGKQTKNISLIILVFCFLALRLLKTDGNQQFLKALRNVCIGVIILIGILGVLAATSFTKYFTIFHEVFFTNDLWLLDPATDLLINILPETFFIDITFCISGVFIAFMILFIVISSVFLHRDAKRSQNRVNAKFRK